MTAFEVVTVGDDGIPLGHAHPACGLAAGEPLPAWPGWAWACECVELPSLRSSVFDLDPATHGGQAAAFDLAVSYEGGRPFMVEMAARARDPTWWPNEVQARAILATRHHP